MDILGQLAGGFGAALSPANLLMAALGSLLGTLVCVVGMIFTLGIGNPLTWSAIAVGALIFWRHRENIRRIVSGEEKKKTKV